MRTLVTGAGNPYGLAIAQALLDAGHDVRLFAADQSVAARLRPGNSALTWFAGDVATVGSIEPALSERQVLVHAACLDSSGADAKAHAIHIERGTLACRYGAEREQVDHFIAVLPAESPRRFAPSIERAAESVHQTRGTINVAVVRATSPAQAASDVVAAIARLPELGKQPGRETDAVSA